jgi:hypothetical protein
MDDGFGAQAIRAASRSVLSIPCEAAVLRGIPVLVALDQARFIIRSRNLRNVSGADEDRQTVGTLKMADELEWEL